MLRRLDINIEPDRIHFPHGNPSEQIHRVRSEIGADLIVLGTVCRTGIAGFLIGNTAEQLLSWLDCSVLTLKPEGFQSPVAAGDDVDWPEKFPMI
jgi:nucleotide-binding universal stress UspA family protein